MTLKLPVHVKEQPLHKTLKQYRVFAWVSILFLGYMMYRAWVFFEAQHQAMTVESAAGFFTYVMALLTAFIKAVNNVQGKHEE